MTSPEGAGLSLGWKVFRPLLADVEKPLAESGHHRIVQLRSGARLFVPVLPALSGEEEELAASVLLAFQREAGQNAETRPFSFCREYCAKRLIRLDEEQKKALVDVVEQHAFLEGPLTPLLCDPALEEISVAGTGFDRPVRVFHRQWGWLDSTLFFTDADAIVHWANRLARRQDRALSLQSPRLSATLSNGDRLHAAMPPIAFDGPCLTVRKFASEPFSWSQLVRWRTISFEGLSLLARIMRLDANVLVCGNTGSGKTTTLNALLQFVPPNERLVVIEETPEVKPLHRHVVRLTAQEGVGLSELVVDSLRMRPDRLIVGEVRSRKEVRALADTLLAGQGKGSIATFHAQGGEEAFRRLERLGVDASNLASVDCVVVQRRFSRVDPVSLVATECRRVTEISEVLETDAGPELRALFGFDYALDQLVPIHPSQKLVPRFFEALLKNDEVESEAAWDAAEQRLRALLARNLDARAFFNAWHSDARAQASSSPRLALFSAAGEFR